MPSKREYLDWFNIEMGKNIMQARKERKVTQTALAKVLGISRVSITNIESGKYRLSLPVIVKMCDLFKMKIDEILPRERKPVVNKVKYLFTFEGAVDREDEIEIIIPNGEDEIEFIEQEFKDWLHNQFDATYSKVE